MRTSSRGPDPTNETIRALLARSGNLCAFAGCIHPIVNEQNLYIAQLCHIEAAAPGGPRYNPKATDVERRSYRNLLLLCYRHHVETNNAEEFSAEVMRRMKESHEARFQDSPFRATEEVIATVAAEASGFWKEVARRNLDDHVAPSVRIEIDTSADAVALFRRLRKELDGLKSVHDMLRESDASLPGDVRRALSEVGYDLHAWDSIPYWENPTDPRRNFELLQIGLRNLVDIIAVLADQLEIRHLEAALAGRPEDPDLRARIEELRAEVLQYAAGIGHAD